MSLFVHESLAGKLEMILLKATDTVGIMGENWIFDLGTGNPIFVCLWPLRVPQDGTSGVEIDKI